MRHFVFGFTMLAFVVFSYGFLCPMLVSYPDTMLVLAGLFYGGFIVPIILWYFIVRYWKYLYDMKKENT